MNSDSIKNTLKSLQTRVPTDKLLHFLVSYFLASVLYSFTDSILSCIIVTLFIGLGKEYYVDDVADTNDFLADALGVAAFLVLIFIRINLGGLS